MAHTAKNADPTPPRWGRVELHVHLEGALSAERALSLAAAATDVPPPPSSGIARDGAEARWQFENLRGFLELFGWGTRLLRTPEAYAAVLGDLAASYREQGVRRAEVFVAVGQMHYGGIDPHRILPRLAEEARRLEQAGGPSLWFVADATRNWGVHAAERVLDTAIRHQAERIVGFGMGGDERSERAGAFRSIYRRAAEHGLGLSCHAGEGTDPQAVREVVEELGVRRVGHGIAAVQDERLLRELREEGVVLEVCPTSNQRTGVWEPRRAPHPLLKLIEHGVPVVLGSDDPGFFGCTLRSEFERAKGMGLDDAELERMERTASAAAFPGSGSGS